MHSRSPWRCNQTEVNKRGQGEVIGAPRAFKVGVRQLRAAQAITVAFLLQSPDRKKALTAQRTFDSEGESNHPGCVIAPFDFRSQTCFLFFFSLPPPLFCVGVLQRRSCTRTTRRRPCTTTRTRSSGNPNPTRTSWCSTGPFAPPGASSAW